MQYAAPKPQGSVSIRFVLTNPDAGTHLALNGEFVRTRVADPFVEPGELAYDKQIRAVGTKQHVRWVWTESRAEEERVETPQPRSRVNYSTRETVVPSCDLYKKL